MKKTISRIYAFAIVLTLGTIIFLTLLFAGEKTKGPLENFMVSLNASVSRFEKDMVGGGIIRQNKLKKYEQYRNNVSLLNAPDILLFGAYDDKTKRSFDRIVALEDSIDTPLPIIQIYSAWGSKRDQKFPLIKAQAIHDLGSVPMITWEPWLDDFNPNKFPFVKKESNVNEGGMRAIVEGEFDSYIDEWVLSVKTFRHPIFLRFGHEMNDPYRYPWGPQNNNPEDFVKAWQYVFDKFDSAGAKNVVWVWSPHPAYDYTAYYPGKDFVNWTGITALNYGTVAPWSQWLNFDEIVVNSYNGFSKYEHPIMIAEFGSLNIGGDRAAWYTDALDSLPVKYPLIHSVVFFNASLDNTTTYKTLDWSIRDKEEIKAIQAAVKNWDRL